MVSTNCSIASSKMDRATRLNLGSSRVPIRRYHLLNSSRQSDPTCWRFWNKRQDFRNKICLPDFRASFRQRLTSTRQTAACRGHRLSYSVPCRRPVTDFQIISKPQPRHRPGLFYASETGTDVHFGSNSEELSTSLCFPLCPQTRTSFGAFGMSQRCHRRTHVRNALRIENKQLLCRRDDSFLITPATA